MNKIKEILASPIKTMRIFIVLMILVTFVIIGYGIASNPKFIAFLVAVPALITCGVIALKKDKSEING